MLVKITFSIAMLCHSLLDFANFYKHVRYIFILDTPSLKVYSIVANINNNTSSSKVSVMIAYAVRPSKHTVCVD